jgi:hypothetical protein
LNKEKAAVNSGILDISLTLSSEFFPEVGGVLILDILDNRIPTPVVVNLIAISRSIDNVQPQAYTIFLDDV